MYKLPCTEVSSDVRFPLRNRNRNRNLVKPYGISLPKYSFKKNMLEAYDFIPFWNHVSIL